jgi:gluconokinase
MKSSVTASSSSSTSGLDSAVHNNGAGTAWPAARFPALVVMGVSGCGKSSLGAVIATRLSWPLLEGDGFHSAVNLAKMKSGTGLTDADREGWLAALGHALTTRSPCVLTCSALRLVYRERLRAARPGLGFVFMDITQPAALERVAARGEQHFFPPSLVAHQFATLESPVGEAGVLRVDARADLDSLVAEVGRWLA